MDNLSSTDRRIVLEALETYRRRKGAEKMLTGQRIRNEDDRLAHYARYDALMTRIVQLQKLLTEAQA